MTVLSVIQAGAAITGAEFFSILVAAALSPVDQRGSCLEEVEPQIARVSLARSAGNEYLVEIICATC